MRARPALPSAHRTAPGIVLVAACVAFAATGCAASSSSDGSAEAAPDNSEASATASAEPQTSTSTSASGDGEDAAAALSGFACSPAVGASERWTATGTLTNDAADAATYQLTVVVVGSTGTAGVGSERVVEVPAQSTTDVDVGRVLGPLDGTCHVQVVRVG